MMSGPNAESGHAPQPAERLTREEVDRLATYNGERARGLVHTPEWQAKMAELQRRFDSTPRERLP